MEYLGVCKKRTDYFVSVSKPNIGYRCFNELEKVEYEVTEDRPFIIRGTVNEPWATNQTKLCKTYNVNDTLLASLLNGDTISVNAKNSDDRYFCVKVDDYDGRKTVKTSWGDYLHAEPGDIIVYSMVKDDDGNYGRNLDDSWVIDHNVFSNTYEREDGFRFISHENGIDYITEDLIDKERRNVLDKCILGEPVEPVEFKYMITPSSLFYLETEWNNLSSNVKDYVTCCIAGNSKTYGRLNDTFASISNYIFERSDEEEKNIGKQVMSNIIEIQRNPLKLDELIPERNQSTYKSDR